MTNAKPPRPQGRLSPALLTLSVFFGLTALTAALWWLNPGLGRVKNITRAERPSDDHYLAHDLGGHVDHHVLYFGTDRDAIEHLRRADVLLLGNSRLMFAARPGVLDAFFEREGLRYYVLGFGFREGDLFPLAIIERFDLRPDLVVVNADGFFTNSVSEFAESVMDDSAFGAWQFHTEAEIGHEVRRVAHQLLPNWLHLFGRPGFPWRRELIIYRSKTNGSWQLSPWPLGTAPIAPRDLAAAPPAPGDLEAARAFKAALERRGSRLALTYVPTARPAPGNPVRIADALDVPLLLTDQTGLVTEDSDHLDEASAVAWSERFVQELERVVP